LLLLSVCRAGREVAAAILSGGREPVCRVQTAIAVFLMDAGIIAGNQIHDFLPNVFLYAGL